MKKRLVIILSIIILAPLGLFFILGVKMASQEEQYIQERFKYILQARLSDIKNETREIVAQHERTFLTMLQIADWDMEGIRSFIREQRMVRQIFLLDSEGQVLFPPALKLQTARERDFFVRTQSIWEDRESFYRPWEDAYDQVKTHGWYTWFWGKGINIIFWMLTADGLLVGIEVDGIALAADIIGRLPDSARISPELASGRIVLADISAKIIYQWGAYTPAEGEAPFLRLPMDNPLTGWELQYFLSVTEFNSLVARGTRMNIVAAAVLGFILLVSLGIYFYRENTRALRDAARRVTFVNQVSHELKTPLTNIRLYAELLDAKIDPEDFRLRHYLTVIVSESQRLSRLILNVLTFARDQKKEIRLRKSPGSVDSVISKVIENYSQSFREAGIEVLFEGQGSETVSIDKDILEQILNNLFSNVKKYAAAGKSLKVHSYLKDRYVFIRVADNGEGIPVDKCEKIFTPFFRLSCKLSDGVTGTGLGLTIARRLARLHGGDLRLESSPRGACFLLSLEIREPEGGVL